MKILVLNGSPKGEKSNTYRITDAFLNGVKTELGETASIETVDVSASHIEPCKGCFGCWTAICRNLPFMTRRPDSGCTHPRRYEGKTPDQVLISTCGFYSIENNYEALNNPLFLKTNLTLTVCWGALYLVTPIIMIPPSAGALKHIVLKCSRNVMECSGYGMR